MKIGDDPNFSIVLPGGCNASCKFCFWHAKKEANDYLEELERQLNGLPNNFRQLSITGGEPTTSSYLPGVLKIISRVKDKYKKVILTTNGSNLATYCRSLTSVVDHINISRHSIHDVNNVDIFRCNDVPSTEQLRFLCNELNECGIDVTLSCVLTHNNIVSPADVYKFIDFARYVGASFIVFRKLFGDLLPSSIENKFNYIVGHESKCPACRGNLQYIKGFPIIWRCGVMEPTAYFAPDEVYELVFHENGELTLDWSGNIPYFPFSRKENNSLYIEPTPTISSGSTFCGRSDGC